MYNIDSALLHCKKSVLKIQEYIHEGANLKFYIPEFLNSKLLIPMFNYIELLVPNCCILFLQCLYYMVARNRNTIGPPPTQLSLHIGGQRCQPTQIGVQSCP
jgi:hypothetical protein